MKQKKIKCPVCNTLKAPTEFEWLPKQHKYHDKCVDCTKEISLRNNWKISNSKKKVPA